MSDFGGKGGRGATRGRTGEVIAAGQYRKRVFFGQRILVVVKSTAESQPLVRAVHDEHKAQEWLTDSERLLRSIGQFEFACWMWADTVNGEPCAPAGAVVTVVTEEEAAHEFVPADEPAARAAGECEYCDRPRHDRIHSVIRKAIPKQ